MNSAFYRNAFGVSLALGDGLGQDAAGGVKWTPGVAAAVTVLQHETYRPSSGQHVFTLQREPLGVVLCYVNGLLQDDADYAVAGAVVTWQALNYQLEVSDRVDVVYGAVGA